MTTGRSAWLGILIRRMVRSGFPRSPLEALCSCRCRLCVCIHVPTYAHPCMCMLHMYVYMCAMWGRHMDHACLSVCLSGWLAGWLAGLPSVCLSLSVCFCTCTAQVCVCVCVRARACVYVCMHNCEHYYYYLSATHPSMYPSGATSQVVH